jgi:hypothetical protein
MGWAVLLVSNTKLGNNILNMLKLLTSFQGTCKVLSESSRTVIVVTASVKQDETGGQDHTSESLLHQSAM